MVSQGTANIQQQPVARTIDSGISEDPDTDICVLGDVVEAGRLLMRGGHARAA